MSREKRKIFFFFTVKRLTVKLRVKTSRRNLKKLLVITEQIKKSTKLRFSFRSREDRRSYIFVWYSLIVVLIKKTSTMSWRNVLRLQKYTTAPNAAIKALDFSQMPGPQYYPILGALNDIITFGKNERWVLVCEPKSIFLDLPRKKK